jgi:excinuclease UvrABC nuclease subunit
VQKSIDRALSVGDYETAEALRQRLEALKEIRAIKAYERQTPLARAVIAFVQASDDEAAARAFATHRTLLDTHEAEKMLAEAFEAQDDKARSHLRRRAEMLKELRTG